MRVACVHTGLGIVGIVTPLFQELVPEAKLVNFVDDAVVKDAVSIGKVDQKLTRRMCNMFLCAELSGAQAILLTCSTVGETVDVGSRLVRIPILRIDEPMAEKAVELGKRIAVVATVASTVAPSSNLVRRKAAEVGKDVKVNAHLCEGAFDALGRGDTKLHDEMVVEAVRRLARESDVVVLAQASMLRVQPTFADLSVPVLTSPRLGVERMRDILRRG